MSSKRVKLYLKSGEYDLFKIKEGEKKYYVFAWKSEDIFGSNYTSIGDAKNFEDAIQIARANATGPIKSMDIDDL